MFKKCLHFVKVGTYWYKCSIIYFYYSFSISKTCILVFWQYCGLNSEPCTCEAISTYPLSQASNPFYFNYFSGNVLGFCLGASQRPNLSYLSLPSITMPYLFVEMGGGLIFYSWLPWTIILPYLCLQNSLEYRPWVQTLVLPKIIAFSFIYFLSLFYFMDCCSLFSISFLLFNFVFHLLFFF
jgi:hypothetical protein